MRARDNDPRLWGLWGWDAIRSMVWQHKQRLLLAQPFAILASGADIALPLLFPFLLDEVVLGKPGRLIPALERILPTGWHRPGAYIATLLLATLFLRLTALALKVVHGRVFTYISKDVVYRLRCLLLKKLRRISLAEYETLGSGWVAAHYTTDLDTMDQFIGPTVNRFVMSLLTLAGIAAVLLYIHWQLGLFILLLNPLLIYSTVALGRWVKGLKRRENEAVASFQDSLTETLDSIAEIRAGNRELHYLRDLMRGAQQVRDHSIKFKWKSDAAQRFSFNMFLFGFDVFRGMSMLMVLYSGLSIGQMIAIFGYLWMMMGPLQELLGMQYAYFAADAALGRINRLLALKEEVHYPSLVNPFAGKTTVGIRIHSVHFAYGEGEDVLNGVSLDIGPAEKVALIGASGAGKSTLVQALLGLYPLRAGAIYYDGKPISHIGLEVVRENVAVVLQHPAIFNTTVRENLTLGLQRSDAELWQVLEMAQLRKVVERLDSGLDTVIGRRGVRFSGGQRQRLAIARLVLKSPKVVILDEATSAVDLETEQRLYAALGAFLQQRTAVIIAHRLSAVRHVDRVYVFENGMILEEGSHENLLRQGGVYAKLFAER